MLQNMERTVTLQTWFDSYAYMLRANSHHSSYINIRLNALEKNIIRNDPNTRIMDYSPNQLLQSFQKMSGLKWSYIGQVIAWTDEMFQECINCGERSENPAHFIQFIPTLIGGEHL